MLEWAEKELPLLPEDYLRVRFEVLSPRKRSLELTGFGEKSNALLRGLSD